VGTPEEVHARLEAYVRAGVDEFVVQWFNFFGIEGRERIGHEIAVLESLMT
jgi:alkanesulfonate monooxygenase SsuD/methylene tetrahydromethanopterin reductase-like flavin-dependent oxidoreductase (luciferase family)